MENREVTVYLGKDVVMPELRSSKSRRVLRVKELSVPPSTDLFFICRATLVGQVADLIRGHRDSLRGLLVLQDVDPPFVTALLDQANLRNLRNLLVHGQEGLFEKVSRILNAWEAGAEDKLIAHAAVAGDQLLVRSCDFKLYTVPFDSLKALRNIAPSNRDRFEIASDGSYLYWAGQDIHLDLGSFRYAIDPAWRAKKDRERLVLNRRFGAAVAALRKEHELTQSALSGVSEREIRRIEKGDTLPRSSTLEAIAQAHGMTLNHYLSEVAIRV